MSSAVIELPGADGLPAELSSFVGRVAAVREVAGCLDRHRLVTLVGPAGAGKTRLAVRAARDHSQAQRCRPYWIELAVVTDSARVLGAIGEACGLSEVDHDETLVRALRRQQAVLVMDNCEQVLDGCAAVVERLLGACPSLRVLATSRERLAVAGEVTWQVEPLDLPQQEASMAQVKRAEAVRLFVERASSAQVAFDNSALPQVAAICRQLDGLPLAIELAAGQLRLMSIDDLTNGLDERLDLLRGGRRTADRQRTLRAAIGWSYDLLNHDEQSVFCRLSVFPGAFSLAAAEAICGRREVLLALAEKSLLQVATDSHTTRYRMLQSVRAFAAEQFAAASERPAVLARYVDYFCSRAELGHRAWSGRTASMVADLAPEEDDLRLALELAPEFAPELEIRLAGSLPWLWTSLGRAREGVQRLQDALSRHPSPDATRAQALCGLAEIAAMQSQLDVGWQAGLESLEIRRGLGEPKAIAESLTTLGWVARQVPDHLAARNYFQEALEWRTTSGDDGLIASSLLDVAWSYFSQKEMTADDAEVARDSHTRAFTLLAGSGNVVDRAPAAHGRGDVAYFLDHDLKQARAAYTDALREATAIDDWIQASFSLSMLTVIEAERGSCERALRMDAAVQNFWDDNGIEWSDTLGRRPREVALEKASSAVPAAARAKAARDGAAQSIQSAVRDYLTGSVTHASESRDELTQRERAVAELVAEGHTNRDIATKLGVAVRTVDAHLEHIRTKLGVRGRAEVAAWITREIGTGAR